MTRARGVRRWRCWAYVTPRGLARWDDSYGTTPALTFASKVEPWCLRPSERAKAKLVRVEIREAPARRRKRR